MRSIWVTVTVIPLNRIPEWSVNLIETISEKPAPVKPRSSDSNRRVVVSIELIAVGITIGLVSLALVSNQFGNTDTIGLVLFGIAGWVFVSGICHLFLRLPYAVLIGALMAPLSVALLFILFWAALLATAFQNSDHQDFAPDGVSQIQPANQMNELYDDCRHYISYANYNKPLFNSVAYFGDRYEITMQVPVRIDSKTSGKTIGEPIFYLNEISEVSVLPSGQVSTSYSGNLNFGAAEWKRVYEANGDFSKIGFKIDPTGVPNFKTHTDASRPSD